MSYDVKFFIGGNEVEDITENNDISIQVDFREQIQGNVEIDKFTLSNEALKIIEQHIKNGLTGDVGIFEGLDFQIVLQENQEQNFIFEGFTDFKGYQNLIKSDAVILLKFKKKDGLNNISNRLEGLTLQYLNNQKLLQKVEIDRIVVPVNTLFEELFIATTIFLLVYQLAQLTLQIQKDIAIAQGMLVTGIGGNVGAFIYTVTAIIANAVLFGILSVQLINLVLQFKTNLIGDVVKQYGINFKSTLTTIFQYLGYGFYSNIEELEEYCYAPSNNSGVPLEGDYGFTASEFVEIALNMFGAEIFVNDGVVEFRNKKDEYFEKQSNYILTGVLEEPFTYNLDELKESKLIYFQTDVEDAYTSLNFEGTNATITTLPITVKNPKNNLITGFEETDLKLALGTRKNELNSLEKAINSFIKVANTLLELVGGKTVEELSNSRIGMLQTSNESFSVPKFLKVKNKKLTVDYREKTKALTLYNNYLNYNSFVADNYRGQKRVIEDVTVPFNYTDFKKVLKNSYFTTETGELGRLLSLNWIIGADTANVSYYIKQVYTKNLKEEYYEAK